MVVVAAMNPLLILPIVILFGIMTVTVIMMVATPMFLVMAMARVMPTVGQMMVTLMTAVVVAAVGWYCCWCWCWCLLCRRPYNLLRDVFISFLGFSSSDRMRQSLDSSEPSSP